MKAEYITRTFTTKKVNVSAEGKKEMEVNTVDVNSVVTMYAAMNGISVDKVKVDTKEIGTLYRMTVDDFLKYAEPVPEKIKKEGK